MVSKRQIVQKVSAGGVVYRVGDVGIEVVLCGRVSPPIWALPKGTPWPGESHEETAVREVCEETGLSVKVVGFVGQTEYWFSDPIDEALCHKTVHFYLMSVVGGDTKLHDHEFDEVKWFLAVAAMRTLTYENEVAIVEKCLPLASAEVGIDRACQDTD